MVTSTTKTYTIMSLVFLLGAVVVAGAGWMYIQKQGAELIMQAALVSNYSAREQKYAELSRLVESTKEARQELVQYILTEDKTVNFLAEIEQIAKEQNIDLTTDSLRKIENETAFNSLVIVFAVEGTNENVLNMLRIFETLPYHSSVSRVAIEKADDTPNALTSGTIELTASLVKIKI